MSRLILVTFDDGPADLLAREQIAVDTVRLNTGRLDTSHPVTADRLRDRIVCGGCVGDGERRRTDGRRAVSRQREHRQAMGPVREARHVEAAGVARSSVRGVLLDVIERVVEEEVDPGDGRPGAVATAVRLTEPERGPPAPSPIDWVTVACAGGLATVTEADVLAVDPSAKNASAAKACVPSASVVVSKVHVSHGAA